MKAYDIYKNAASLLFEKEGEDKAFAGMFLRILNIVLAEAYPYENSVRRSLGQDILADIPSAESLDDDIDMCGTICMTALPYGVASFFCQDDGETYLALMYRERFIDGLYAAARCIPEDIEDVYGGAEK